MIEPIAPAPRIANSNSRMMLCPLQRLGDILQQTVVPRPGLRRIALEHPAVTADEEFLEVPADVAGDAALRRGEEPIHRMALRAVYLELGAQRESDVVVGATEGGDLRIAPRLLCGELVAGEAHHGEVLHRQLPLQLFQPLVLRSQAAAAGDVDGE